MHFCSWMSKRNIQRNEIFKFGNHIMSILYMKTHILTDFLDLSTSVGQK